MDDSFAMGYAMGQDSGGSRNNGGAFGDGNGAIWLIFILAILFGGWGNGNRGGSGNSGGSNGGGDSMAAFIPYLAGSYSSGGGAAAQGALTREQACIDNNFQNLMRETAGISSTLSTGLATLDTRVCQQSYETAGLINGLGVNMMQGFNAANNVALQNANAISTQLSDCCCKEQIALLQLGNQVDRNFCQTNFNDQANTTAIIQNAHNDTDRILARLDSMEMARKDETIAALRSQLAACNDQTTAQYIINQLSNVINPPAVPAYPAPSPCGLGNWSPAVLANGYGYAGFGGFGGCCGCNG